jgi:hypothetical protein
MMKSSIKSNRCFKMGISNPYPPLTEARLYYCRRNMGPGGSTLNTNN